MLIVSMRMLSPSLKLSHLWSCNIFVYTSIAGQDLNAYQGLINPGMDALRVVDPITQIYTYIGRMPRGRWYATPAVLPDGNVLIVGGSQQVSILCIARSLEAPPSTLEPRSSSSLLLHSYILSI